MSKVDLHIHSNASDGKFSPEELVRKAAEIGLTVIAIADHDTVDGVPRALAAAVDFPPLKVIPAVEISTDIPEGEAHVLGYFIDYTSQGLLDKLSHLRNSRRERAEKMVAKLDELGRHVDWKRVLEIAGDSSIGRPHIAQALLEKGFISSFQEAFLKYIGRNGPAYVEREKITPQEAVKLIMSANGLSVLAHPYTINLAVNDLEETIITLQAAGLVGLEAYCHDYTVEETGSLIRLAKEHGLIVTGGTDYHGVDTTRDIMMGGVDVPAAAAERLMTLAEKRVLKPSHR